MSEPELLILDGSVLVIRPWFAGSEASWLVARSAVRRALGRASHLAVVIDRTMDTFRREIDPRYKAHRPPAPPDLIINFDRFEEEMGRMGVPVFGSTTHEADDMAASLARAAGALNLPTAIESNDKDLLQLVREEPVPVWIIDPATGDRSGREGVLARLGVQPEQVVDYLSMVGDATDGVGGIPGVGPKTAAALLEAMGSLDAILAKPAAAAELPIRGARALPARLEAGREAALLARRLVRLVDDIDLGADWLERCRR